MIVCKKDRKSKKYLVKGKYKKVIILFTSDMILLHCTLKIGRNELKLVYNFILNSTRISFTKMGNMYETRRNKEAKEYVLR